IEEIVGTADEDVACRVLETHLLEEVALLGGVQLADLALDAGAELQHAIALQTGHRRARVRSQFGLADVEYDERRLQAQELEAAHAAALLFGPAQVTQRLGGIEMRH